MANTMPHGPEWLAQVKWDGVRVLTYFDGAKVDLYNRRLHRRNEQFSELLQIKDYCSASSVILDGEVIALHNGKPSFFQIMRRDSLRKALTQDIKSIPLTYMIFDVLYYNGRWVTTLPLSRRQDLLNSILTPNSYVQTVESFQDVDALFQAIKRQGMEGIVCKERSSSYRINGKDSRWLKVKNYRDINAVIGGFTLNGRVLSSLALGVYNDEGHLSYIGHAGVAKMPQKDWYALGDKLQKLVIDKCPFTVSPHSPHKTHWVTPLLTLKVQFSEWTPAGILRQPSIQALLDQPAEECRFDL